MDLWMWEPTREELANMLHAMMKDDGMSLDDCRVLVNAFPQQPLDFFGALRARVYDDAVREYVIRVGLDGLSDALVGVDERRRVGLDKVPASLEKLIQAGRELCAEQENVNNIQLAREYMRWQDPGDLAKARAAEAEKAQKRPPATYEPDETARAMREDAKAKMRAAAEERAQTVLPVPVAQEEEPEEEKVPWRVENIGEAQRLYESGVKCFDIRPVKDFNRETLKGAISMPAAVRTGGFSDAVDVPDIDSMLARIAGDKSLTKTSTVVVFHAAEASAAYHRDALRALTDVFDDVVEVEGGLPFYFKHFTPGGKRRPRYVGYGAHNEETFWTASN